MLIAIPSGSNTEDSNICLRWFPSSTSEAGSIQTQLPAYASSSSLLNKPFSTAREINSYDSDNDSTSTADVLLTNKTHSQFEPTTVLHIVAQGKRAISFPVPSNELEIAVLNDDKTLVKFISQREKQRSGNCFLVSGGDASLTPLAKTTYKFGPGNPPVIRILKKNGGQMTEEEIVMKSRSPVHRTVNFESEQWGAFEWRYAGRKERAALAASTNGKREGKAPNNLLLLEKIAASGANDGKGNRQNERMLVARLVRSEGTRTPGTRASAAGNGGQLEMNLSRRSEGHDTEDILIDEVTVLATVILMLKKEIDRLRAIQIMIIGGAAGS